MKIEKAITIIYSFLGLFAGFLSNYIGVVMVALLVPSLLYSISLFFLVRRIRSKRIKWLISNSLITFLLVWFVVWIFLNNLK